MTTIVSAVLLGVAVLLAGNVPWGGIPGLPGFASLNLRFATAVPWAIVPMGLYLWIYWRFISGAIGPRDSAEWRRSNLRAHSVPGDIWGPAVLAGFLGFGALLALLAVMQRVVNLPDSPPAPTPAGMPFITLFLLLVMASIVAGVTEEAAFRGYMQTPIERRYGVVAAILVNGAMFGLLHFPNHPGAVLTMLPVLHRRGGRLRRVDLGDRFDSARARPACGRRRVLADTAVDDRPRGVAAHGRACAARVGERLRCGVRRRPGRAGAPRRRHGVGVPRAASSFLTDAGFRDS